MIPVFFIIAVIRAQFLDTRPFRRYVNRIGIAGNGSPSVPVCVLFWHVHVVFVYGLGPQRDITMKTAPAVRVLFAHGFFACRHDE